MGGRTTIQGRSSSPSGWLDRHEVAVLVGIHAQNVLRWAREGKLPKAKQFGNIKVWKQTDIERYLVTLEVEPEDVA